jgi:hypothetical protein
MTLVFYKQYFPNDYEVEDLVYSLQKKFPEQIKFVLFGFENNKLNFYSGLKYVKKGCSDLDFQKIHLGNPVQFFYEGVRDEFIFKVSGIAIQGISLGCSIFAPNKGFFIELSELVENKNDIILYDYNLSFNEVINSLNIYLNSRLTNSEK